MSARFEWELQGGVCWYCKRPVPSREATVDHVRPKSKGGDNTRENRVMSCRKCNEKKGAKLGRRTRTPSREAIVRAHSRRDVVL